MARLAENVERVLGEVRAAVEDWRPMRERTQALIHEFSTRPPPIDEDEREEAAEFLTWVAADHFTFLGYRDYELVRSDDEVGLRAIIDSGLGILRGAPVSPYTRLGPKAVALAT